MNPISVPTALRFSWFYSDSPRAPGYCLELEYFFSPFTLRSVVIAVLSGLTASVVNMDIADFLSSVRPTKGHVTSRCGSCH